MSEYRDYGQIVNRNGDVPANLTTKGQVYQATHRGNDRLSYMHRSFISFSYGGKQIEDFNLIAITDGDRINRSGYSSFSDIISKYDLLDGQQYWGTSYEAKELELNLSTDGMDQRQLDDFLYWFRPGEAKELILAEHPNRAILARLANPPELQLLPFESVINVNISGYTYPTRTTLYKGEININFIMDEPHWYSKENLLGKKDGDRYIDVWTDANGQEVNVFTSQDALKILYEDGIPLGSMIQNNMLLGNGAYASVEDRPEQSIWEDTNAPNKGANDEDIIWTDGVPGGKGARIDGILTQDYIDNEAQKEPPNIIKSPPGTYIGIISGAIIDATGNGITSLSKHVGNDRNVGYFYYSGTAPSPTIITFTLTPTLSGGYIKVPYNSHTTKKYNTITIESTTTQELRFTTPNILTSYNKVIDIFKAKVKNDYSWEDIRASIRDEVRHKYVRQWAIKIIDNMISVHSTPSTNYQSTMINNMTYFLKNTSNEYQPMTFVFNSETGEAVGTFSYRTIGSGTVSNWATYGTLLSNQEEDVGDMLRSNYIIIRDRNYPTASGAIVGWEANGKTQSHRIYHDVEVPLYNLSIWYKNMYL